MPLQFNMTFLLTCCFQRFFINFSTRSDTRRWNKSKENNTTIIQVWCILYIRGKIHLVEGVNAFTIPCVDKNLNRDERAFEHIIWFQMRGQLSRLIQCVLVLKENRLTMMMIIIIEVCDTLADDVPALWSKDYVRYFPGAWMRKKTSLPVQEWTKEKREIPLGLPSTANDKEPARSARDRQWSYTMIGFF